MKYPDESVFLAGRFAFVCAVINDTGLFEPDSLFDLARPVRVRIATSDCVGSCVVPLPAVSRWRVLLLPFGAVVDADDNGWPKVENDVDVRV